MPMPFPLISSACRKFASLDVFLVDLLLQPAQIMRLRRGLQGRVDEAPQTEQPFRALNEARLVSGILPAICEDQQLASFRRQFAKEGARYVSQRRGIPQANRCNDIEAAI